jgi:transposase InsO family protein
MTQGVVKEIVSQWRRQYNEDRPRDALAGLLPAAYARRNPENSTSELSTCVFH